MRNTRNQEILQEIKHLHKLLLLFSKNVSHRYEYRSASPLSISLGDSSNKTKKTTTTPYTPKLNWLSNVYPILLPMHWWQMLIFSSFLVLKQISNIDNDDHRSRVIYVNWKTTVDTWPLWCGSSYINIFLFIN